jgi:hypothetical protein
VGRRINPAARGRLQTEIEERNGFVLDVDTGSLVKVATITPLPASGKFTYKPKKDAARQLRNAIDAGTLTEDGEIPGDTAEPQAPEVVATEPRVITSAPRAEVKSGRTPTDEQTAVMDSFGAGDSLVVEAGAGAGKTSTLAMSAESTPGRRGMYVAYNAAIASDAKGSFPPNVKCSTAHALAMGAVGRDYRHRLNGPRIPSREQATILGITQPVPVGDRVLSPQQLARIASETVAQFCKSDAPELAGWHVPHKPGLDDKPVHAAVAEIILPMARRAWADLTSYDGKLRFDHGVYLKLWQLSHPILSADFILFDEAQDASPVILDVVVRQTEAQLVAVGDRAQAINGWTGAINAMDKFPAKTRLTLSQSFRFGSQVAKEANKWLSILGTDMRLKGFGRISSMVRSVEHPDAILCRTNAEAMVQAMRIMDAGATAAIVGGGDTIRALAEAAADLKAGRGTGHPELFAFRTWSEVQDHAENDATGSDLRVLVDLIDEHGPAKIIALADGLSDEKDASVTISTAHKSKGREWDSVQIAGDFREPKTDPESGVAEIPDDMAMLAYVAVTRGRLTLDRAGLAWVDNHLPGVAG